jgi:kynurenine formamidase
MAGVSPFVDVSVRLVGGMPFYSGNPELERQPIRRLSHNVDEMFCLPLPIVDSDGAPPRAVLKR